MTFVIRRAERKKAKLRLALMGTSGSGKTYSALQLAFGLGGKIGFIDTEHGSGELYAHLGEYDVLQLEAPYTVEKYRNAIKAFEDAGCYSTIIIDSLSHAWAGEGGLLDKQGQLESSGRFKNSFATWREITPDHNKLVEELLNSPCHIIGTMRSKTEYALEQNDKGKTVPRKIGLAPVQRDGLEYEFTVVLDINQENHVANATKDRTGMFDRNPVLISTKTGEQLKDWLEKCINPASPLTLAADEFERRLNECNGDEQVQALIKKNGRLLQTLKEKDTARYEDLMKKATLAPPKDELTEAIESLGKTIGVHELEIPEALRRNKVPEAAE